jgi:hypothetical protein
MPSPTCASGHTRQPRAKGGWVCVVCGKLWRATAAERHAAFFRAASWKHDAPPVAKGKTCRHGHQKVRMTTGVPYCATCGCERQRERYHAIRAATCAHAGIQSGSWFRDRGGTLVCGRCLVEQTP